MSSLRTSMKRMDLPLKLRKRRRQGCRKRAKPRSSRSRKRVTTLAACIPFTSCSCSCLTFVSLAHWPALASSFTYLSPIRTVKINNNCLTIRTTARTICQVMVRVHHQIRDMRNNKISGVNLAQEVNNGRWAQGWTTTNMDTIKFNE